MKRKLLSLLLTAAMVVTMAAGCGKETANGDANADANAGAGTEANAEAGTEEGQAQGEVASEYATEITWADMMGDVTGTLTIFPATEEWTIEYENPFGAYKLAGWYLGKDGSMACIDDAGIGAFLDFESIEAVASPAILAMIEENNIPVLEGGDPATCVHKWLDGACAVCQTACTHENWENSICADCGTACTHETHDTATIVCETCGNRGYHTFVDGTCGCGATTIFEMNAVPAEMMAECDEKGTIETISYDTYSYALEAMQDGEERLALTKEANVYLPYGYDANESYDILYLMHGGGGTKDDWLVTNPATVNILDNCIKQGLCDPIIVVTPSFYSEVEGIDGTMANWVSYFDEEMMNELIPAVEAKYATYAKGDVSAEALKASRAHRAYAGLSMGSMTSWSSILDSCTDYIGYVGSYSAGPEADVQLALTLTEEIAANMKADLTEAGNEMYYWFNGNGVKDIAHDPHLAAYPRMLELCPEVFTDGVNSCWVDYLEGMHSFEWWQLDLYNSLKVFFELDEAGENPELQALAEQGILH